MPQAFPDWRSTIRKTAWEVMATALVFAALTAKPTPGVNETHYLAQAKHLWDPQWCQGDLLLEANKAHALFFWQFGWLTQFVSLTAFAWAGRIATWLFQAAGFVALVRTVSPSSGWSPVAALAFLGLQSWTMFAGEWVIGGFEAKPLAYGCAFFALSQALRRQWGAAAFWIGAAAALHPLVGGWCGVGLAGQWLAVDRNLADLRRAAPGLIAGAALAAVGLVPAMLINRGASPEAVSEAHRLYLTRLAHHLDPRTFDLVPLAISGVVSVGVLLRAWSMPDDARAPWGFLVAALAVAAVGFVIRATGLGGDDGAALLRFYWFRLADFAVPLCAVLTAAIDWRPPVNAWVRAAAPLLAASLSVPLIAQQIDDWSRTRSAAESLLSAQALRDWRDLGAFAANHTPKDALFVTPRNSQTFKWHAGRGEVATWKDVPQEAEAIVEWNRRLAALLDAGEAVAATPQGSAERDAASRELARVADSFHARYIVRYRQPRLTLPVSYENQTFVVYRVDR